MGISPGIPQPRIFPSSPLLGYPRKYPLRGFLPTLVNLENFRIVLRKYLLLKDESILKFRKTNFVYIIFTLVNLRVTFFKPQTLFR